MDISIDELKTHLVGVEDIAAYLGVTRQRAGQLIRDGELPSIKVGRAFVSTMADLEKLKTRRDVDPEVLKQESKRVGSRKKKAANPSKRRKKTPRRKTNS